MSGNGCILPSQIILRNRCINKQCPLPKRTYFLTSSFNFSKLPFHFQSNGCSLSASRPLVLPPQIPTPPPTPSRNPPASRTIPIIKFYAHLLEQLKEVVTCNLTADAHPTLETRGIAVSLLRENSKEKSTLP